jgi:hypothetical protein
MKKKTMLKIPLLLLVMLASQLAIAQSSSDGPQSGPSTAATAKQVAGVRSKDTPSGTVVTITSDELLSDYGAYRNGDTYRVLIPAVSLALNNIHVQGSSFSDAKVEAVGTNLAFSFRLQSGVNPSVSQKANQLEITFARLEVASAGAITTTATVLPRRESEPSGSVGGSVDSPATTPAPQATPPKDITPFNGDLAVPDSPAFTVLGVTPETVTHPTTPKEFATSFLNGVDERGHFQTGLALDFVPFLTFFGRQTDLEEYAKHPFTRFLARTQLSFATAKGVTDEDKSTRLALGLRMTIFDKGDPRLDDMLEACYKEADATPGLNNPSLIPSRARTKAQNDEQLVKRGALYGELTKSCDDAARKRNWNASGWIVGLAPSWISKTGETKNFEWNGGGFWSTIAYGFENVEALKNNSQVLFHVRYRNNEIVPDTEDPTLFFSQDSFYLGGRLRIAPGEEAKSIFSLEGNYIRSRKDKGSWDNSRRFSLGLERRIAENIWFALSVGGQGGRSDGANHAFVLSSFKWGFQQKTPPPTQ